MSGKDSCASESFSVNYLHRFPTAQRFIFSCLPERTTCSLGEVVNINNLSCCEKNFASKNIYITVFISYMINERQFKEILKPEYE